MGDELGSIFFYQGEVMNRRELIRVGVLSVGGVAVGATRSSAATLPSRPVPYGFLDRLPDEPTVIEAAKAVVLLIREIPAGQKSGEYGGRMRILSKSLGLLAAEQTGSKFALDPVKSYCVSGRIEEVVREIGRRKLDYPRAVRAIVHAMGFFSEEHRQRFSDGRAPTYGPVIEDGELPLAAVSVGG